MIIRSNTFSRISADEASCAYIENNREKSNINQTDLKTQQNRHTIENPEAEILNNTFINNAANRNCSGVYVKDYSKMMIQNNTFRYNKAYSGSCLYLKQDNSVSSFAVIRENKFLNGTSKNVAQVFYQNVFVYDLMHNEFRGGNASYSPNAFSYPKTFKLNLKGIEGNVDKMVESNYTVHNYAPNL